MNERVNRALLDGIPAKGFAAVPPGTRGRNVAQVFVHLHKVRLAWLNLHDPKRIAGLPTFEKGASPNRAALVRALRASGRAVATLLDDQCQGRARVSSFKGNPVRFMAYLIAHDSHHRGQIALTLKLNGMRLPDAVAFKGLWFEWYFGRA